MIDVKAIQQEVYMELQANGLDCHDERLFFNSHTLRMTKRGFILYSSLYKKIYVVELGRAPLAGELIQLLRKMNSPYTIDSKKLKLVSEQDAFMCKLAGWEGWIQGK
jgi:hypothetical protein